MTVSKIKFEKRTILDLTQEERLSKNKISKLLRDIEIISLDPINHILFDNSIKIGAYNIKLVLNSSHEGANKLKRYGHFAVRVYENFKEVNVERDRNFKDVDWVERNKELNLRITDLVDVILYCKRLDNLYLFN
jgi:hypothetical protein